MTVTAPSAADLLDLNGISQREETIRFDLLDQALNVLGQLAVDGRSVPEVANDVNRPIRRTMTNLQLLPRTRLDRDSALFYAGEVNVLTQRVRPSWVLGAGGVGYEFPLGVFLWGDDSTHRYSFGTEETCTLVDQCLILTQPLAQSVSYPIGTNIGTALAAQAAGAGLPSVNIQPTTKTLTAAGTWVAGNDTTLTVMEALCAAAGFYAPYFDNNGTLICQAAPVLSSATPTILYAPGGRILAGTMLESNDLLKAPNRYVVVDTSATTSALVGTFDVPAAAPYSFANRGFYVVKVIQMQGLASVAAANDAAAAAYAQDSSTYKWLSFSSTPDPRHDTFDILGVTLDVGGVQANYREQSWRLPLAAGSQMAHDTRGIY